MSRALIEPATWRCRHCGGRERYRQGQCVECQRARMREARRRERMADDPTELHTRAHDLGWRQKPARPERTP
jgi:predicted ATP-dependent serine protease